MDGEQPAGLPHDARPVPRPPLPGPPGPRPGPGPAPERPADRHPERPTPSEAAERAPEADLPYRVADPAAPAHTGEPAAAAHPHDTDDRDESVVVPEPPATGDPGVDEAVQLVAASAHGTLDEQVQAYESAHRTLQDRLADVES